MTWPGRSPVLLSAALTVLGVGQALGSGTGLAATAAVLLGTLGVLLAVRAPVVLAGLAAASGAVQAALDAGDPAFASFLVLLVAAYSLGRRSDRPALAAGFGLLALGVGAVVAFDPSLQRPVELVFPIVYLGGAGGLGRLVRSRERAAEETVAAIAAAGESREREVLAEERARIAREMHDVVAHSVSLLVVQAESAAAVLDRDPERAREQLDRISTSGRQALDELRRVLGLLQPGGEHDAHPQPGLDDLDRLRETVEAAGARVELHVGPGLTGLAPGIQLTAYRIVQEALTNAVRHGRARTVRVEICRRDGALTVEICDDGRTVTQPSPGGHGLRGMRERVRLYGGDLEVGPVAAGGFRVAARLPVAAT